jgi:transcriptional regulator with XRE-family HTH domain
MEIGNKLKSLRIEKGFETIMMADRLGISDTTYRRYERNESTPDLNMLEKIAKALDKNIFDLLPETINYSNVKQKGGVAFAYNSTINQLSEKLIEQYELRIKEKNDMIALLKETKK